MNRKDRISKRLEAFYVKNDPSTRPKKKKKPRKPSDIPTEHQEQVQLVALLRKLGLWFFAVPNGGLRGKIEAGRLRHEGVQRGVPDLIIVTPPPNHPDARGVAIEMKRQKGGTVSVEQKEWIAYLKSIGWLPYVAKGFDAAKAIITDLGYLREKRNEQRDVNS